MKPLFLAWARGRLPNDADPRLIAYLEHPFKLPKWVHEARFVVFDSETSGLDLKTASLLSLGAVAAHERYLDFADRLEITVRAEAVGGALAATVHQLRAVDLVDGLPPEEAALRFLDYAKDSVLVAHHAGFDLAMLTRTLRPLGLKRLFNPVLDTGHLSERLFSAAMAGGQVKAKQDRSLDALCERFGVDIQGRHTASGDAMATAELLLHLLAEARRRKIQRLKDLLR